MFDSLLGGIVPTALLAAVAGAASALFRRLPIALLLAVASAIAISFIWFYVPVVLWPAEHTDPQGGWDLVAAAFWSVFAVPSALLALAGARVLHRHHRHPA